MKPARSNPWLVKCIIAGVAEVIVIVILFASVEPGNLTRKPSFTELDAILWTFVSMLALGLVILWIRRSTK
jgi:uncharacterized membrane protein